MEPACPIAKPAKERFYMTSRHVAFVTVLVSFAAGLCPSMIPFGKAPGLTQRRAEAAPEAVLQASSCSVDSSLLGMDGEEWSALLSVNTYREAYGLQPLEFSYALQRVAAWKSTDGAVREYLSHDDGFRSWEQRFVDCGYDYPALGATIGENLAAGMDSGWATVQAWQNTPAHNANLLNPNFTAVGIKRVYSPSPYDPYHWYWSMELGSDAYDYGEYSLSLDLSPN
jgi:uncharacterized protein YkwD